MFEKFVDAGGKVVKEKKPEELVDGKPIAYNTSGKGNNPRSRNRSSSNSQDSSNRQRSQLSPEQELEKEISSFTSRLAIKFKCWFGGVTGFSSALISPKFLHEINTDFKSALMDLQMMGTDLLTNPHFSPKIATALDRTNPLMIEILALAHKLYNSVELNDLTEPHMLSPDVPIAIERVKPSLYAIFKKLYILYPYGETFRRSVTQGYAELQTLENKSAILYTSKRKKAIDAYDRVFDSFFERLYLLIIRNENKNIPIVSSYMEKTLGITAEDKPGKRVAGADTNVEQQQQQQTQGQTENTETKDEKKEEKEEPVSKEMAYGNKLMTLYTPEKIRKKYDPKNEFGLLPDADKALLSYFCFLEFEEEYSFVMTSKKIAYKTVNRTEGKVDFSYKLTGIYENTRVIRDQFRNYYLAYKEILEHQKNPGSNYIEASKKLTNLETKRSQQSRVVRNSVKDFSDKARDVLYEILNDMKTRKEIVENMEDVFQFDSIEAKKRLHKKLIKQCIMEVYCYLMALSERLANGDLFGGVVELEPEQLSKLTGVPIAKEESSGSSADAQMSLEKKSENSSSGDDFLSGSTEL